MTLFNLLGGRAVLLALFGVSFWQYAIPLIASGLGALFAKKKKPTTTATSAAMDALINKQTQQMDQEVAAAEAAAVAERRVAAQLHEAGSELRAVDGEQRPAGAGRDDRCGARAPQPYDV